MAYPFAAAEVLTAVDLNAMIGAPTQNAITTVTYTAVLLDAGKTVTLSNASAVTLTIPAQASVSWAANTQLNFLNIGAGTVTITPAADVTINGTPLTLATSKGGSLVRTASNVWTFIPFSGGAEAANFTNTATGTYTDGGVDYKYITFTGIGSLVVDRAGFADILVIGGGAGGGSLRGGGGGAGGHLFASNVYLSVATHAVVVGAGGAGGANQDSEGVPGNNGIASSVAGFLFAPGGGGGGFTSRNSSGQVIAAPGLNGASGGGSAGFNAGSAAAGGAGITGLGNAGGQITTGGSNGAGGGGAGAVGGSQGNTSVGGAGGTGIANSITNVSVTRAGGGGGEGGTTGGAGGTGGGGAGSVGDATGTAGSANLGGGGGGGGNTNGNGGNGGSGLIIVRVVV